MREKIKEKFSKNPINTFIFVALCICIVGGIIIAILPDVFVEVGLGLVVFFMVIYVIIYFYKDKKAEKRLSNMSKLEIEKKWEKYVNLVEEIFQNERDNLDNDWVITFHELVYAIAANGYYLNRMLYDFDIAACLIYSLTWKNNSDENVFRAFECAKHLMEKPKTYRRILGYGNELEIKIEKSLPEVNLSILDKEIGFEKIILIIETYLIEKTEEGILQLSDFLHILYLKCNN